MPTQAQQKAPPRVSDFDTALAPARGNLEKTTLIIQEYLRREIAAREQVITQGLEAVTDHLVIEQGAREGLDAKMDLMLKKLDESNATAEKALAVAIEARDEARAARAKAKEAQIAVGVEGARAREAEGAQAEALGGVARDLSKLASNDQATGLALVKIQAKQEASKFAGRTAAVTAGVVVVRIIEHVFGVRILP